MTHHDRPEEHHGDQGDGSTGAGSESPEEGAAAEQAAEDASTGNDSPAGDIS